MVPSSPARILVVDDDLALVRLYVRGLEAAGHRVSGAGDGDEALLKARGAAFDVVVSDVCMPRMGGLDLAERIRAMDPNVPILLMTARLDAAAHARARARDLGILRYLRKPIALDRLDAAVEQALRLRVMLVGRRTRLGAA